MTTFHHVLILLVLLTSVTAAEDSAPVKEVSLDAPHDVKLRVRMEGPYTAETQLQVVCYFPYSATAAARMSGAPVELDRRLGGVIAALRERGAFSGHEQETLRLLPPPDSIPATNLLLIGLGSEADFSLEVMSRVGATAFQQSAALGVERVAFAPLLRDQGNSALPAADVEFAVVKAMLLACDTEHRLHSEGLAKAPALREWVVEAGPAYFDDTVAGVKRAIEEAQVAISLRSAEPYRTR